MTWGVNIYLLSTFPANHIAGNDNPLNVTGPFVDLQSFDVAIVALDRIDIRVTPPAVQ
jgi:hypothetical protein